MLLLTSLKGYSILEAAVGESTTYLRDAGPDGSWVIGPITEEEIIQVATIDHNRVLEERQNLDPSGHYSRPDFTQLHVDRTRQSTVKFKD